MLDNLLLTCLHGYSCTLPKVCGFIPLRGPARRRGDLNALVLPLLACLLSSWDSELPTLRNLLLGRTWRPLKRTCNLPRATWLELETALCLLCHVLSLSFPPILRGACWMNVMMLKYVVLDVFLQWSKWRSLSVMPKSILDLSCYHLI